MDSDALPFERDLDIHYLILQTKDFVVFLDKELDVDWKTTDAYDARQEGDSLSRNKIKNRMASLECIPNDHLRTNIRRNYKRMLGEGLARSFNHDYENAMSILDDAEQYIRARNIEAARYWQLSTSCLSGIFCGLAACLIWAFRIQIIPILGETGLYVVLAGLAGGLGALISIIFRMGNAQITTDAERKLHMLEAISRIMGGVISGLIISIFVKLGLFVPVFQKANEASLAMVAAGLVAGASERWVPSLIAQFENGQKVPKPKGGK
ncbi:hypothetical protein [Geobacter anodireducens]|uniref:Uncharacterized protein n=1 Tax=Geobacter anodireducens TaxID=1340425 RepID=A0ABR9NZG9_9BACT|nr:hypothetical protein [Geobacter anodireducens]MBE2889655.1 hypothetical protein [Geobacter anodireducens]